MLFIVSEPTLFRLPEIPLTFWYGRQCRRRPWRPAALKGGDGAGRDDRRREVCVSWTSNFVLIRSRLADPRVAGSPVGFENIKSV